MKLIKRIRGDDGGFKFKRASRLGADTVIYIVTDSLGITLGWIRDVSGADSWHAKYKPGGKWYGSPAFESRTEAAEWLRQIMVQHSTFDDNKL